MSDSMQGIAIIGMAGRFPKARNVDEFWKNLCEGVEGISFFSDEELAAGGVAVPKENKHYIKVRGVLDDADLFDAAFFGMNPKEAEVTDPQHRVFLECAWEALESAGWDAERFDGAIGVFAGMSMNTYAAHNLASHPELISLIGDYQVMLGNDKDFLPTRVSYKLNLKGPSLNIQTACSTSLVAVCVACQHLLNYQCDMALAGAVSVSFPQKKGHLYREGGIASPDGHCRPFDANSGGTVAGEGAGIVVLKRLEDALADGDSICAVIKGFAINNDGAAKIGYTAPSVEGQAEVIALAQAMAGVEPETISYVEAHGTGTPLGDPIEIEGLTKAFRAGTAKTNFCAVGSVKSNIGHLDTAAGVAGLIKTTLALQHKLLPPTLHYEAANPKIDFANSPFFVNAKLTEWKNGKGPRRAGVSSFGIGGTNAHVVLEEAPVAQVFKAAVSPASKSRPAQLILLSAKTATALDRATANLAEHLKEHPELNLADVAHTLQVGRREFAHRRMLVCRDTDDAANALASLDPKRVITRVQANDNPPVVFMFPGQGAQHVNMGLELYESEQTFREDVDACCELLKSHLGLDLRTLLFSPPRSSRREEAHSNSGQIDQSLLTSAATELARTAITQPAMFVIEYALARLWMSWGVKPEAMIGHSIGEYVAACLAGVFSLEDALKLVAERGRLMQQMPAGTMLAVRLPEREVLPLLTDRLSLATVNGVASCVVSGPTDAVEELRSQLAQRNVANTPLQTSHAFHSAMMEPMLGVFTELVRSVNPHAPELPFVSNVTGTWITAELATDPAYWARQLRHTVRFGDGLAELLKVPERVLLEVGPGQTLSNLAKQHPAKNSKTAVVSSMRRASDSNSDVNSLLTALGELWLCGTRVDWRSLHADEPRRRVRLPTYPFERKRYWIEPGVRMERTSESNGAANGNGAKRGGGIKFPSPEPEHRSPIRRDSTKASQRAGSETGAPIEGKARLIEELSALFAELSGLNLDGTASTTTFTELGFESLFLTQASLAIEKKFGVRIAFRQLLEEANSLDGLAGFIESQQSHPPLPVRNDLGEEQPNRTSSPRPSPPSDGGEGEARFVSQTNGSPSFNGERRLKVNLDDELHRLRRQETQLTQAISVKDMRSYPGLEQGLNELCSAYVCDYFRTCGITFDKGRRYGIAELKSALQLRPAYEKFFRFMLTALEEDGIIRLGEDGIECLPPTKELPNPSALHERLLQQHPAFAGLLDMLQHCARNYRAALAGDILGVSVLLPDGRHDFLKARLQEYTDQYRNVRRYESVAKQLVLNLSRKTPLRILEVGGGGGDLAWQLVPELVGRGCEYHFTDIGLSFIQEALKEAARRGLNFMKFGALDISKDPVRQGFHANSFDVVLGLNVVHATARVDETLAHLKELLVPGGLIGLVELTKSGRWDTMIIGLAEGWWLFDDAFRKSSPLLDLARWEEAFRAAGFSSVSALPSDKDERDVTDAGLILAQWQPDPVPSTRASINSGNGASAGSRHSINGKTAEGDLLISSSPLPSSPSDGGEGGRTEIRSLALTPAQSEVWFASQLGGDASCAYNDSRLLHFRGSLQATALHSALQKLIERHEALRIVFSPDGDAQHILPRRTLELPLIDLSPLGVADREKQLAAREADDASQSFDVVEGPLIRARLIRLAAEHHVLFLTIHHLVCDGHSWGILLRDLAELYTAEGRGIPAQLDPPLQFSEFAREHVRRQNGPDGAVAAGFWVKQFSEGAPVLELPTDQTRPSNWTFRGARESRTLDSSLNQALKRLSAAHDCTLFTTLLAAHYVLLQRLTGQDDFVVGIPAADRAMDQSGTLVGHCVNFLPVRVRFAGKPTFAAFLAHVKQTFFAAYEHRDFTLGTLIQKLNLPRDPSRMPLVSVTFNFGRLHGALQFAALETGHTMNAKSFSSFDLSLSVADEEGELHLDCRYNTSLFQPETIRRWLGHFQTLLEGIVARPQTRMAELPLLSPDATRQILVEWNDTRTDYPKDKTVARLFDEQVARTPEGVAVEFEGAQLSYRELNKRANQLAHHLQKRGVGPDVLVAVCLERSLDMLVSLLGILKAGGAYLPLDAAHPKERLALMLEEAHAPMVLTQDKLRPLLPEAGHVLCLDLSKKEIGREPMTNPVNQATAESLAYTSFTSGSTGRPKGVCVPHRAIVRLVKNTNYASFAATDVFLQLAPLAFDAATFEIWGPLLNGARLVIFPPHAPTLGELGEFIQQRGITTLWLSAGLFHQMIEEQSHSLRGVRQLLAGGDVLSVPHVKRALAALPDCRLINGYGPTENTTFTCCHQITNASVEARSIPIGRPIANTQVYVLDQNLQPVPVGVPGELYTGGDGLARGYLNQPELTAEKFIPNPFANDSSARLYKTGDLARWLPDGSIEFLGRLDAQVKIRGNRVELSEIETVLTRHPAVRECVVVARKDRSGDKQLAAYFAGTNSARPAVGELREHLRRALPDYMIPSSFFRLQSLPLTANGKVDRKALPAPGEPESKSRELSVAVSDDVEKRLAEIWQEVLGHSRVGVGDDFFELGGHSLLALRLIARVETAFGKRIPVASVFHSRTVAQMARLLRQESQPPRATSIVEIQPQGSLPPLMLVHGAGGGMLWGYTALAQHLGTDQPVYVFKSRGLDGQEEFVTIEEMAAHYVADLRAFQPQGPYYLGGYCFGGNVAYEMARQLHEQGERVALLALLNSIPPNSAYDRAAPSPLWLARFVENVFYFTGCFLRRSRPERRLFISWYARTFTRKIARLFSRQPPSEVVVDEMVDLAGYPPEQRQLWRTHIHALFRHHTKPYAGRVALLRSRGHPFWCSFDDAYGWRDFAAGVAAIHLVPGAHEQILDEPHVSVLAEELRVELARAQNDAAKVPMAAALPSPSTEPPAEFVPDGEPTRPRQITSSIVEIQRHGSKPPLFFVHGIGGGMIWGYANLSRFLGPDQPVYALNSRGLDGHEEFGTIEAMAAQYVADLRAFQPEGDYRLGGYCFGGNVAYEMARLLEAQGQPVSLLAMFNCPLPNSSYYRVRLTPGFCFNYLKNFINRLRHVARLKPEQRRTLLLWRGRIFKKQCLNVLNRFRGVKPELGANDWVDLATQPEDRRELWAIHLHAYNGYQPKPYGGPVALFRTHDHPLICSFDDACGWREFVAGGVTVHIVPGEHESTLDVPHVRSVAKILETYLQPTPESNGVKSAPTAATTTAPGIVEKNQVPVEWNQTQADYPREKCVHHLFEAQVERTPQAVAVVSPNEQMTYAELNRRADKVAEQLRTLGIGPDVPVGICLERSLEMVIGVLAVLKAGGAYLPLDPAYPTERLNLMIENSRSPLVLTQPEQEKIFKSGNSKVELLCIEDLLGPHPNESRTKVEDDSTSRPTDLAYVIHTSGSTGTPKGVAMPHRPLVNLIAWQVRHSKLPLGARTLQFASLNFDVSFQEMFSTWCAGGTLVLVNENLRRDPVALWRFIRENKIARLFMPFVALQQLAEAFKPEASGDWALREIITAGEQLQTTPALVRMFTRLKDCTLHNHYGPSESHVVTAFTLSGPPGEWPALPSIGRPIANTQIYLLDEQRQPVPVGVPGELYIGGDCLANGYLHQPELTAGRFIAHPFSNDAEARLYETGDLARYQPDGNIEFLGRTDQQVKIRGFRIELGEIEATLRQHLKVRDAVVMARADQPGPKRLAAYYISKSEQPCAGDELRLFLKDKLPEYMVPTAFVALEVFPLTPSGKVARNRLPAPDHSRHDLPGNFEPPATPTQQALARIWCDVLGLPQIGIHDDFFELGGNSILAVQAIARMSELFGVELPVSELFESPTIALVAKELPSPPLEKERHEPDREPAMAH